MYIYNRIKLYEVIVCSFYKYIYWPGQERPFQSEFPLSMYSAQVNFNTKLSLSKIIMQVQTVSETESKEAEFVCNFCSMAGAIILLKMIINEFYTVHLSNTIFYYNLL